MTITDDIKLDEYEDDDMFDIVVKLEKSFAIKFDKDALSTLGPWVTCATLSKATSNMKTKKIAHGNKPFIKYGQQSAKHN